MPKGFSQSQARVILLGIWTAAACINCPWIIAFRIVTSGRDDEYYCVESWPDYMDSQLYFLIGSLVLCFVVPLTLISISNGLIGWQVSRRKVPQERVRKIRGISVVALMIFISRLPLYLIFLRIKFGGPLTDQMESIISITMPFAQWLGISNSSWNPILYAFLNQKFGDSFKSLLSRPTCINANMSDNRQSTPRGGRRVTSRHPIDHV
jgi:neuropeptide FF receptor 2